MAGSIGSTGFVHCTEVVRYSESVIRAFTVVYNESEFFTHQKPHLPIKRTSVQLTSNFDLLQCVCLAMVIAEEIARKRKMCTNQLLLSLRTIRSKK